MKVLFAVSNESISESIVKKYQQMYKEIILSKNVYYFNAILKELQKDKTYDRVVISEDLEPFTNNNYETIDNFIFEKLDGISDEASTNTGEDIPIILIATDRRTKSDNLLIKLFGIGVYSALLGQDRSIDEVCKLIQKPRSKKEAKIYYNIDSNDVDYKPENEGDVSETEIQNILTHYKRLGRNEERYVESFDSIASQYTDQQLKVIIRCLPLNVKAVLEENSPRYQQLISFNGAKKSNKDNYKSVNTTKLKNNTSKAISNSGIKVESIASTEKKLTKPVIIPSATSIRRVQEEKPVETYEEVPEVDIDQEDIIEEIQDTPIIEEPRRGRGRPRKVQPVTEENVQQPKRGRGRPRKNPVENDIISDFENFEFEQNDEDEEDVMIPKIEDEKDVMPEFEDFEIEQDEDEEDVMIPKIEDEEDVIPEFEEFEFEDDEQDEEEEEINQIPQDYEDEDEEDVMMPQEDDDDDDEENVIPGFDNEEETNWQATTSNNYEEDYSYNNELENYNKVNVNLQTLLTKDKKIVAFIGTSKNGTSFLINNIADMLSNQGIKTAILDLTSNRNSYYIYTKNEEDLRKISYSSIEKLTQGIAQGIKVNTNLDVYTSVPGENNDINEYQTILETLVKNYSLVLLDCDFSTNMGYLKESQEIYLVQSMDVLTIQPLTAYLRDLKAKGILKQDKLRAVINKYTKVRGVSEKAIIGGMAFYNDPAMSFMTELFNRETIPYTVIPFDGQAYSKYLEALVNCSITLNGYPKDFVTYLRKLANMVYPLVGSSMSNKNTSKYGKYETPFSSDINSTLDKMKRNF